MKKPLWRVRSSEYVVRSPYMRMRKDELELPDGTVIPEYFVRESEGFVTVFALTAARDVVTIDQYRYGNDRINLELPAGTLAAGEDPLACAQRELAEETGYTAEAWHALGSFFIEPSRSVARMHAFLATGASRTAEQHLDPAEAIEVRPVPLDGLRGLLHDGSLPSLACVATVYRALDALAQRAIDP